MSGLLKKAWHDPVWSKVIATIIIGIAGVLVTYFAGWWPIIAQMGSGLVAYTAASTQIPNWLLGLLILCAVLVIGAIGIAGYFLLAAGKPQVLWATYTTDEILGIKWRWHYGSKGLIYELYAYCPSCDLQVYARNSSAFRAVDHIAYFCEHCGKVVAEFQMPEGAVENLVKRTIQKKIRTVYSPTATDAMGSE